MRIVRHDPSIPAEALRAYFEEESARVGGFLEAAQRSATNLHQFFSVAKNVYLAGSAVAPDAPAVAAALRHSAQALIALALLESVSGPTYTYRLGDSSTSVPLPVGQKFLDVLLWDKAYELSIITRQPALVSALCGPDTATIGRACGLKPGHASLAFFDLAKEVWQTPEFVDGPALRACEAVCAALPAGPGTPFNEHITKPRLAVVRALAGGTQDGTDGAFERALRSHKAYWSSSRDLRKNPTGFVSLPLTMLAALAWDRGIRVGIDSDYMPRPWVTGEAFR
jgi:hypothetical protein